MRFLVDANLPPALARLLVAFGHTAQHVAEEQLLSASDSAVWNRAIEVNAIIISKDKDFAQRRIFAIRKLLQWFGAVFPGIVTALESGETLIEAVKRIMNGIHALQTVVMDLVISVDFRQGNPLQSGKARLHWNVVLQNRLYSERPMCQPLTELYCARSRIAKLMRTCSRASF